MGPSNYVNNSCIAAVLVFQSFHLPTTLLTGTETKLLDNK